jgi:hypothetical protein
MFFLLTGRAPSGKQASLAPEFAMIPHYRFCHYRKGMFLPRLVMIENCRKLLFTASLGLALTVAVAQGRALADNMTVDEIRDCMCQERALQNLRQETSAQQATYGNARTQLQSLNDQIEKTRSTMNPSDDISVQILAEMIRQRDALNTQIRSTSYPQAQAAVAKLNAAVASYNQGCAQRSMLKTDVDAANRNLVCPAP